MTGEGWRQKAGVTFVDAFFRGLAGAGRLHPRSRPEAHGLEVIRDLPYTTSGREHHLLDVYRPIRRDGPLRTVLYVHGGGFRILSKESHWLMGLAFAKAGAVVFNINYRLAPQDPFPAAIEDVCRAYEFVLDHAARFGGDPSRLVLAGESAGANLITALTIALTYRRPEPFAAAAFARGVLPKAVLPACGIFQVTDPGRFERRRKINGFVRDRIHEVSRVYLPPELPRSPEALALADPLPFLETGPSPERPLPPFFLPVGTKDVLLDDTRRLAMALTRQGARAEARYYPGGIHAFHAFVWQKEAKRCWQDSLHFTAREA